MNLDNFTFKNKKIGMTLVEYTGDEEVVVIPDTFNDKPVTIIGKDAFSFNKNVHLIQKLVLPKDLEVIESFGVADCSGVKFIQLPEKLREIKQDAFCSWSSLEEIVFPASLEKVAQGAFFNCTSLKKVVVENENTKIAPSTFGDTNPLEEVSFSVLKVLPIPMQSRLLSGLIGKFTTLPESQQEEIKSYLKKKSTLRKELFLNGTINDINFLFGLKVKLTLEVLEEYIENSIKSENTEVTAMFLEYKNNNFSSKIQEDFKTNKELVEIGIELPTLKQFKAKWKCVNVDGGLKITGYKGNETHETIPKELADGTKIVEFGHNDGVKLGNIVHLEIQAELTVLNYMPQNESLETVILPDTIVKLGAYSIFYECSNLKKVNIPNKLQVLTRQMFFGCENLEEIEIPDSVTTIASNIFHNCTSLKEIVLPEKVTEIPRHAFYGCTSLTSVTLSKKLKKIDNMAFNNCTALQNINLPDHPVETGENVFGYCEKLADDDGFFIFQDILYNYYGTQEKVVIPNGVKIIERDVFKQNITIKEVIFADSLERIGVYTFAFCENLEKVTVNQNLKQLDAMAFFKCEVLQPFDIPNSVETIGENCFTHCLLWADEQRYIIVRNCLVQYLGTKKVVTLPDDIETLDAWCFRFSKVKEVTLPNSLKVIAKSAFYDCKTLEKVNVPDCLEEICDSAFNSTPKLKELTLPKGVKFNKDDLSAIEIKLK